MKLRKQGKWGRNLSPFLTINYSLFGLKNFSQTVIIQRQKHSKNIAENLQNIYIFLLNGVIANPLSTMTLLRSDCLTPIQLSLRPECYLYSYHSAVVVSHNVFNTQYHLKSHTSIDISIYLMEYSFIITLNWDFIVVETQMCTGLLILKGSGGCQI